MGLVINTNTSGIKNSNTLSRNARRTQRSMAKLASGAKINRAADDASGLAISNKMRNQIAVLDIDVDNCDDGANMLQVADGAMAEVSEMLIRCSVLAGRATNGILGDEEREIIQDEIDELHEEIDRIYLTTNFNGIQVFGEGRRTDYNGDLPSWMILDDASRDSGILGATYALPHPDDPAKTLDHPAAVIDMRGFNGDLSDISGTGFNTTCCGCEIKYSFEFTDDASSSSEIIVDDDGKKNPLYKIGLQGAQTPYDVYQRIEGALNGTVLKDLEIIVKVLEYM